MDQTEKYLNDILKKRLGSVVNYGASSKTATTVTRLPKKQEKIQSMPTVFRKKHQTVYQQGENSYQFQSQKFSQRQGELRSNVSGRYDSGQNDLANQQKKQVSNQRVEYMLISKRIQQKTQDDVISPTVDVTKYTQPSSSKQIIPSLSSKNSGLNQKNVVNVKNNQNSNQLIIQQNSRSSRNIYPNYEENYSNYEQIGQKNQKYLNFEEQEQGAHKKNNKKYLQFRSMRSQGESISSQAQKSKRKKIFN